MITRLCIILLFSSQLLLSSCSQAQDTTMPQGMVRAFRHVYNGDQLEVGVPSFSISSRIWYWGKRSIQEVPIIHFVQDTLGKTSVSTAITHYSYINPDNGTYCTFTKMDESLEGVKYFPTIDSVLKNGGLDFYSETPFEYEKIIRKVDTLEKRVEYQRFQVLKTVNNINVEIESYLRCDKKGSIVTFLKLISDSLKCPIVRTNVYENGRLTSAGEFEHFSDKLTSEEVRIFDLLESKKRN